ncbi:MAG: hypothetical protein MUF64_31380 [Polyangiaceae bacterium]|jgi:hypothetical protein|nr:hypothetical protein [Polyangiaceae bacterium]
MTQEPTPPRILSAALPPGYTPQDEGEPAVVLYFRIYSGLVSLSSLGIALFTVVGIIKQRADPDGVGLTLVFFAASSLGLFSHLIGVLSPRRPWMHVVGIVILGLGLLSSCLSWVVNLPLLIYWLKPEVKRWFDTPPAA